MPRIHTEEVLISVDPGLEVPEATFSNVRGVLGGFEFVKSGSRIGIHELKFVCFQNQGHTNMNSRIEIHVLRNV